MATFSTNEIPLHHEGLKDGHLYATPKDDALLALAQAAYATDAWLTPRCALVSHSTSKSVADSRQRTDIQRIAARYEYRPFFASQIIAALRPYVKPRLDLFVRNPFPLFAAWLGNVIGENKPSVVHRQYVEDVAVVLSAFSMRGPESQAYSRVGWRAVVDADSVEPSFVDYLQTRPAMPRWGEYEIWRRKHARLDAKEIEYVPCLLMEGLWSMESCALTTFHFKADVLMICKLINRRSLDSDVAAGVASAATPSVRLIRKAGIDLVFLETIATELERIAAPPNSGSTTSGISTSVRSTSTFSQTASNKALERTSVYRLHRALQAMDDLKFPRKGQVALARITLASILFDVALSLTWALPLSEQSNMLLPPKLSEVLREAFRLLGYAAPAIESLVKRCQAMLPQIRVLHTFVARALLSCLSFLLNLETTGRPFGNYKQSADGNEVAEGRRASDSNVDMQRRSHLSRNNSVGQRKYSGDMKSSAKLTTQGDAARSVQWTAVLHPAGIENSSIVNRLANRYKEAGDAVFCFRELCQRDRHNLRLNGIRGVKTTLPEELPQFIAVRSLLRRYLLPAVQMAIKCCGDQSQGGADGRKIGPDPRTTYSDTSSGTSSSDSGLENDAECFNEDEGIRFDIRSSDHQQWQQRAVTAATSSLLNSSSTTAISRQDLRRVERATLRSLVAGLEGEMSLPVQSGSLLPQKQRSRDLAKALLLREFLSQCHQPLGKPPFAFQLHRNVNYEGPEIGSANDFDDFEDYFREFAIGEVSEALAEKRKANALRIKKRVSQMLKETEIKRMKEARPNQKTMSGPSPGLAGVLLKADATEVKMAAEGGGSKTGTQELGTSLKIDDLPSAGVGSASSTVPFKNAPDRVEPSPPLPLTRMGQILTKRKGAGTAGAKIHKGVRTKKVAMKTNLMATNVRMEGSKVALMRGGETPNGAFMTASVKKAKSSPKKRPPKLPRTGKALKQSGSTAKAKRLPLSPGTSSGASKGPSSKVTSPRSLEREIDSLGKPQGKPKRKTPQAGKAKKKVDGELLAVPGPRFAKEALHGTSLNSAYVGGRGFRSLIYERRLSERRSSASEPEKADLTVLTDTEDNIAGAKENRESDNGRPAQTDRRLSNRMLNVRQTLAPSFVREEYKQQVVQPPDEPSPSELPPEDEAKAEDQFPEEKAGLQLGTISMVSETLPSMLAQKPQSPPTLDVAERSDTSEEAAQQLSAAVREPADGVSLAKKPLAKGRRRKAAKPGSEGADEGRRRVAPSHTFNTIGSLSRLRPGGASFPVSPTSYPTSKTQEIWRANRLDWMLLTTIVDKLHSKIVKSPFVTRGLGLNMIAVVFEELRMLHDCQTNQVLIAVIESPRLQPGPKAASGLNLGLGRFALAASQLRPPPILSVRPGFRFPASQEELQNRPTDFAHGILRRRSALELILDHGRAGFGIRLSTADFLRIFPQLGKRAEVMNANKVTVATKTNWDQLLLALRCASPVPPPMMIADASDALVSAPQNINLTLAGKQGGAKSVYLTPQVLKTVAKQLLESYNIPPFHEYQVTDQMVFIQHTCWRLLLNLESQWQARKDDRKGLEALKKLVAGAVARKSVNRLRKEREASRSAQIQRQRKEKESLNYAVLLPMFSGLLMAGQFISAHAGVAGLLGGTAHASDESSTWFRLRDAAATVIQSWWRGMLAQKQLNFLKDRKLREIKAEFLQRFVRMFLAQKKVFDLVNDKVVLSEKAGFDMANKKLLDSTLRIQKTWRMRRDPRVRAALELKNALRMLIMPIKSVALRLKLVNSMMLAQSYRKQLKQRVSVKLLKQELSQNMDLRHRSASLIQATWRGHFVRIQFLNFQRAIWVVQTLLHTQLARRRFVTYQKKATQIQRWWRSLQSLRGKRPMILGDNSEVRMIIPPTREMGLLGGDVGSRAELARNEALASINSRWLATGEGHPLLREAPLFQAMSAFNNQWYKSSLFVNPTTVMNINRFLCLLSRPTVQRKDKRRDLLGKQRSIYDVVARNLDRKMLGERVLEEGFEYMLRTRSLEGAGSRVASLPAVPNEPVNEAREARNFRIQCLLICSGPSPESNLPAHKALLSHYAWGWSTPLFVFMQNYLITAMSRLCPPGGTRGSAKEGASFRRLRRRDKAQLEHTAKEVDGAFVKEGSHQWQLSPLFQPEDMRFLSSPFETRRRKHTHFRLRERKLESRAFEIRSLAVGSDFSLIIVAEELISFLSLRFKIARRRPPYRALSALLDGQVCCVFGWGGNHDFQLGIDSHVPVSMTLGGGGREKSSRPDGSHSRIEHNIKKGIVHNASQVYLLRFIHRFDEGEFRAIEQQSKKLNRQELKRQHKLRRAMTTRDRVFANDGIDDVVDSETSDYKTSDDETDESELSSDSKAAAWAAEWGFGKAGKLGKTGEGSLEGESGRLTRIFKKTMKNDAFSRRSSRSSRPELRRKLHPLYREVDFSFRMAKVEAGDSFGAGLTNDGFLFTWGSNANGRCGQGKKLVVVPRPELVPIVHQFGRRVVQFTVGWRHVMCLTQDNRVFVWGAQATLHLLTPNQNDTYIPSELPLHHLLRPSVSKLDLLRQKEEAQAQQIRKGDLFDADRLFRGEFSKSLADTHSSSTNGRDLSKYAKGTASAGAIAAEDALVAAAEAAFGRKVHAKSVPMLDSKSSPTRSLPIATHKSSSLSVHPTKRWVYTALTLEGKDAILPNFDAQIRDRFDLLENEISATEAEANAKKSSRPVAEDSDRGVDAVKQNGRTSDFDREGQWIDKLSIEERRKRTFSDVWAGIRKDERQWLMIVDQIRAENWTILGIHAARNGHNMIHLRSSSPTCSDIFIVWGGVHVKGRLGLLQHTRYAVPPSQKEQLSARVSELAKLQAGMGRSRPELKTRLFSDLGDLKVLGSVKSQPEGPTTPASIRGRSGSDNERKRKAWAFGWVPQFMWLGGSQFISDSNVVVRKTLRVSVTDRFTVALVASSCRKFDPFYSVHRRETIEAINKNILVVWGTFPCVSHGPSPPNVAYIQQHSFATPTPIDWVMPLAAGLSESITDMCATNNNTISILTDRGNVFGTQSLFVYWEKAEAERTSASTALTYVREPTACRVVDASTYEKFGALKVEPQPFQYLTNYFGKHPQDPFTAEKIVKLQAGSRGYPHVLCGLGATTISANDRARPVE